MLQRKVGLAWNVQTALVKGDAVVDCFGPLWCQPRARGDFRSGRRGRTPLTAFSSAPSSVNLLVTTLSLFSRLREREMTSGWQLKSLTRWSLHQFRRIWALESQLLVRLLLRKCWRRGRVSNFKRWGRRSVDDHGSFGGKVM